MRAAAAGPRLKALESAAAAAAAAASRGHPLPLESASARRPLISWRTSAKSPQSSHNADIYNIFSIGNNFCYSSRASSTWLPSAIAASRGKKAPSSSKQTAAADMEVDIPQVHAEADAAAVKRPREDALSSSPSSSHRAERARKVAAVVEDASEVDEQLHHIGADEGTDVADLYGEDGPPDDGDRSLSYIDKSFKTYYLVDVEDRAGEDQYVMRHYNTMLVIGLAPTHPARQAAAAGQIASIDYSLEGTRDLGRLDSLGKKKKTAIPVEQRGVVCNIRMRDGTVFRPRCCVNGMLVECNRRLEMTPELLIEKGDAEGFLAIVMPSRRQATASLDAYLSREQYHAYRNENKPLPDNYRPAHAVQRELSKAASNSSFSAAAAASS